MKHEIKTRACVLVVCIGLMLTVSPSGGIQDVEELSVFDDLAAVFYYGGGRTRFHTWLNNEDSRFEYSTSRGWFSTDKGGYEADKLVEFVAGDWNGDGLDDLAGFYDYGGGVTRLHVWLCDGYRFNYQKSQGWWESDRGYDANKLVGVAAGDFDGDGFDDIAGFYDYGNDETRIHIWLSNGLDGFRYQYSKGWWASKGYPADGIVHVVAGEFRR